MNWRRTNGFHPLHQLGNEVDRLMGGLFAPATEAWPFPRATRAFPAVNVWEGTDELYAEAELPGLKSDELEISVVGNELTIKGHRRHVEREGAALHRRERGMGEFSRVLQLPVEIDADKVQAVLRDGVLTLTLPKAVVAKPTKIQVTSAS
jgi:HSP20 family protein